MSPIRWLWLSARTVACFALAMAVMVAVNLAAAWPADQAGWGQGNARLLFDLGCYLLSGLIAALVFTSLPARPRRWHLFAWLALLLGLALAASWQMRDDWPVWFVIGLLLGMPLQALCLRRWLWPRSRHPPAPWKAAGL
ncbi:hypothetical protein [Pseudoxanthomonas dokdonensis]|uniref:Uncharacterized protein n=1 Tax=Pseudoxanthomonas dokdonensis TaxID=344882 RepID=A0A0R0D062_9GAMM|nr:hypothetical protein [Pseudoxanthomonas dokdonensis]KRG71521.1 hypothetical protein ABB29_01725 [Pseudoxanthomonas dokdonensis]